LDAGTEKNSPVNRRAQRICPPQRQRWGHLPALFDTYCWDSTSGDGYSNFLCNNYQTENRL